MISLGQASVSLELREVFRSGVPLRVGTRAFDILELLISCPGQLVTKDEILQRVWPDTVVEENNLQVHISALRKALGADRDLIRTIPGRGYILICGEDESSLLASQPQDAKPDVPLASSLSAAMSRTSELPHDVALVGREEALEEICEGLLTDSLMSLVGAGGIGKTSLAVAVAHHLSLTDSLHVCFVPLASITCAERIVEALAFALDLDVRQGQSMIDAIVDCVDQRNRLIILDNCEHLIEAVAAVCEHLLHRCPSLRILTTSREPLRISRERTISVAPLVIPGLDAERCEVLQSGAAQLFLMRLRALDSRFPADDSVAFDDQSVALVGQVCRALDGIPLALEMAASRAAALGLFELAGSLKDNLHLLSGGLRSAPQRHQSMEASVEWSYRLLNPDERTVLGCLGGLAGCFSLDQACEAAQTAAMPRARVMDGIVGLAQKSLLVINADGPFRFYRLLGATRAWILGRKGIQRKEGASGLDSGHDSRRMTAHTRVASLATLMASHPPREVDHFHLNHQRVLAASQ
jgi:predicted ATPase/DNA-binding winged helix-turn-helix (wHTH) protein